MPTYEFQLPDGRTVEVEASAELSPEQALAKVMPALRPAQSPTAKADVSDIGPLEAAFISAGRTFNKLGAGAKDIGYRGARALRAAAPEGDPLRTWAQSGIDTVRSEQEEATKLMGPLEQEYPLATMFGAGMPYMSVPVAAPGAGVAAGMLGAGALGAIGGGLEYSPTLAGRAENALMSGAGAGIGYGAGRAVTGLFSKRPIGGTQAQQTVYEQGRNLGLDLPGGKYSQSRPLQQVEVSLASFPPTSGGLARLAEKNQKIANQVAAKALGETADDLGAEVMDSAANRISNTFRSVLGNRDVPLDARYQAGVQSLLNTYKANLHPSKDALQTLQEALELATQGTISAERAHAQSSRLGKLARAAIKGPSSDPDYADALRALKDVFDDAILRAVGPDDAERLMDARSQWRNLLLLESPGVVRPNGNLNAATLGNKLRNQDPKGYTGGRNTSDLYTLGRFAQAYSDITGDSGTATRMSMPWLMNTVGGGLLALGGMQDDDASAAQKYGLLGAGGALMLGGGWPTISRYGLGGALGTRAGRLLSLPEWAGRAGGRVGEGVGMEYLR